MSGRVMPHVDLLKTGRSAFSSDPANAEQEKNGKDFALRIADMIA
jgi:hypothetical protein